MKLIDFVVSLKWLTAVTAGVKTLTGILLL